MHFSDEQVHRQAIIDHLHATIEAAGGQISFDEYMQQALYAPGLGYYSVGTQKFGPGGDFVTAPELSPLFAQCLAAQCGPVLAALGDGATILELGAGSGKLASELLLALETDNQLPAQYLILEVSAELRQRQHDTLQDQCPQLLPRVQWLDRLPNTPLRGIILGNEVLDALPVACFRIAESKLIAQGVTWQDNHFAWCDFPAQSSEILAALPIDPATLPNQYRSEICLQLPGLINSLNDCLEQGVMLWVDYGESRAQYYRADRTQGTLRCFYRHQVHGDPFLHPGLQDITAHVDFTYLAESAVAAGLHVTGFSTQAAFLVALGIAEFANYTEQGTSTQQFTTSQQIQQLTSPEEMGERFRVMALTKDFDEPLAGFALQDLRYSL